MWYLYMLVGLYLFMPLVRFCVRAAPPADLRLLAVVWFAIAIVSSAVWSLGGPHGGRFSIFIGSFFIFMPYCVAGYLIGAAPPGGRTGLLWLIAGASGFASILMSYLLAGEQDEIRFYCYSFTSITVVPMSLALFALARRLTKPLLGERWTSRVRRPDLRNLSDPSRDSEAHGIVGNKCDHDASRSLHSRSRRRAAFLLSGLAAAALAALPGLRRTVG